MEAWRQYGGFYRLVDFTTSWTYDTPSIETRTLPAIVCPLLEPPSPCSLRPQSPRNSPERSGAPGRTPDLELDDIGLELQIQPVIDPADHGDGGLTDCTYGALGGNGLGLLGLEVDTTLDSPGSSQVRSRQSQVHHQSAAAVEVPSTTEPISNQKKQKKTFRLVKKWFSSVVGKLNLDKKVKNGRRNRRFLSISTPSLPIIWTVEPLPLALSQEPRSVSFVDQQIEEQGQELELEIELEKGDYEACDQVQKSQKSGTVNWTRPLALREWKEWGYYARPWINGVFVANYPPRPEADADTDTDELSYTEIEKLAESLIDEHGNEHPEIWIPGVQHPSLPPRPPRWSSDPAPYWSGQCELNPYLRRKLVGEPPLFWDMGKDPLTAVHGHNLLATPLLPPDRAQPATWPMTTHFFISALADDVEFKWPVLIRNKDGVTVQDVLEWIYTNFQEAVDCDEWATWPMYLRTIATISYDKRGERDYLKRIDYLGFHSMFRGFEHSPDGQSWYLYIGRPY